MKLLRRIVLLGVLWPLAVEAADSADVLLERGANCMEKADYPCALSMFQRAHEAEPSPRTLAQVGLAEQALERWVDAESHLAAALAQSDNRWLEKRRGVLEDSLERIRARLADLSVTGSPRGAEVVVDGEVVGILPLRRPLRVVAGQHRIAVRSPSFLSAERTKEIMPGAQAVESFELAAVVAPPPPPVSAPAPVSAPPAAPVPGPVPRWRQVLGVAAVGTGAALATLGGVWLWLDGRVSCATCTPKKAYDMSVQGPVALTAGGLILASGILALSWPGPATTTSVAVTPSGLQLSGRF